MTKTFTFDTLMETPKELLPEVIPEYDIVDLEAEDLGDIKKLYFKDNAKVNIAGSGPLPKQIDFTNCSEVILSGRDTSKISPQKLKEGSTFYYIPRNADSGFYIDNLPPLYPNVDISRCQNVTIRETDLSNVPDLKFRNGASVDLSGCTNLPENLNLAKCSSVNLSKCDLSQLKNIAFSKDAKVDLSGCTNFPEKLDLSKCASVDISKCDLSQLKNITFKEGASINLSGCDLSRFTDFTFKKGSSIDLSGCTNFPENLDLTMFDSVNLSGCDLSKVKNITLKDGASINLSGCTNFPEKLDLSKCASVDISKCDLGQLKNITFKEGAAVNLSGCTNFPLNLDLSKCSSVDLSETTPIYTEKLDLSNCTYVNLSQTDLSFTNNIKFKDNAEADLSGVTNLPNDVDLSNLSMVNLKGTDLNGIKNLSFKDGSEVCLTGCRNIPENLDMSTCKQVWINISDINKITANDTHVVLGGIGVKNADVSTLKDFTTAGVTHPSFGLNTTTFLSLNQITFKDEAQYQQYINNPDNIAIPAKARVIIAEDRATLAASLQKQKDISSQEQKIKTQLFQQDNDILPKRKEPEKPQTNDGQQAYVPNRTRGPKTIDQLDNSQFALQIKKIKQKEF